MHVGHQFELRSCHLSQIEKDSIALKLNNEIPITRIVKDIRDSYDDKLERIHLTLRKDIHNIAEKYNIHCKKASSDVVNTEALIHELGDSVLYYKSQNTICEKYRSLQKDDFFLIIMNDAQWGKI